MADIDPAIVSASGVSRGSNAAPPDPAIISSQPASNNRGGRGGGYNDNNNNNNFRGGRGGGYNNNNNNNNNYNGGRGGGGGNMIPAPRSNNNNNAPPPAGGANFPSLPGMMAPPAPMSQQQRQQQQQQSGGGGGGVQLGVMLPPEFGAPSSPAYGGPAPGLTGSPVMAGPPPPFSVLQAQMAQANAHQTNNRGQRQEPGKCFTCGASGADFHTNRECALNGGDNGAARRLREKQQNDSRKKRARISGMPEIKPDAEAVAEFMKLYDNLERGAPAAIPGSTPLGGGAAAAAAAASGNNTKVSLLDVDRVLRTIEAHDVTFITTDTGTGKSTLLPKALYEQLGAKVVSAQTRRTATLKLAERVADLLDAGRASGKGDGEGATLGKTVGYRIRGEYVGTEETNIMYMTSYTLFLWLLGNPTDFKYTHILIDDFHERPPDVEVTLSLLRLAMQQQKLGKCKPFKLVLLSATVELDAWAGYFGGLKVGTYSTIIPRYPVHSMPLERTQRLIGLSTPAPVIHNRPMASQLEMQQAMFMVKGILCFLAGRGNPADSILVFVPGRLYVEVLARFCEDNLAEQLDPIEWYRDVDVHDLERAFGRTHLNKRKVYIATDIAEVSVTLPDIVFVVDLCQTKKPRIAGQAVRDIAFPPLETFWASQTNLAQRKGRLGRVQSGFYFHVLPEGSERLLPQTVPHICNSRVDELTLHLLQIADRPTEVLDRCFASPSPLSLWLSRGVLQDNGLAIRKDESRRWWQGESFESTAATEWSAWLANDTANAKNSSSTTDPGAATVAALDALTATAKGRIVQFMPLSVQPSLLVWSGLIYGVESLAILAASVCSAGSPFYAFAGAELAGRAYIEAIGKAEAAMRRFMPPGIKSDVITAVHAIIQYKIVAQSRSAAELEAWLEESSMHAMRVESILALERQIADQLGQQVTFFSTLNPEDQLTQLQQSARVLDALVISAFSANAIYVNKAPQEAQKAKSAGYGIFLEFGALRDRTVPSVVEWEKDQVAIPVVVQRRSETLFGYFSMSVNLTDFCAIQGMCAHTVSFHELAAAGAQQPEQQPGAEAAAAAAQEDASSQGRVVCSFEFMTQRRAIAIEPNYVQALHLLRDLVGLRTQQESVIIRAGVAIDNTDRLKEVFAAAGIDARVPMPHVLSAKIRELMGQLLAMSSQCRTTGLAACSNPQRNTNYSTFFGGNPQRHDVPPPAAEQKPEAPKKEEHVSDAAVVFEEDE